MRIVVNVFHANLLDSRVNQALADAARGAGAVVRDMYDLYPDDNIDIATEHAVCESADVLVFQHPMYWYGAPYLMKKWIDTVLTHGWAYGPSYALEGKPFLQAVSLGAGEHEYAPTGSRKYHGPEFLKPFERTAAFCKMPHSCFLRYGAGYAAEDEIGMWAGEYVSWLLSKDHLASNS